jgi:deazaflavin-dependent oxidoreductase (nitroreductase family)
MTEFDYAAFEAALIADMRANHGVVTQGPMAGMPLLIMTSTGAKSGEPRRAILAYLRDGEDYVIAGSKSGAPMDPAWVRNIEVTPAVTVEVGGTVLAATARVTDDADRDALWTALTTAMPAFAEYPKTANRVIPMIRLTPAAA